MKYCHGLFCAVMAVLIPTQIWAEAPSVSAAAVAQVNPIVLVPPAELLRRPQFLSGSRPDQAPEIIAATAKGGFGKVIAQATVTAEGILTDIVILESSGAKLIDDAVVRALQTWKLSSPLDKTRNKVATRAKFPFMLGQFPKRIGGSEPAFPESAKAAFHNGKVRLSGRIDPSGRLVDVKITKSSKSPLLDDASIATLDGYRYETPKDFSGNSVSVDSSYEFNFHQAEAGSGSYISGLKLYKCATFIGETEWWTQANPEAKPSDQEFNRFMGGLAFIATEALGWGKIDALNAIKRHPIAWNYALTECRKQPNSTFFEHYKKG
jgi:TonB family protein